MLNYQLLRLNRKHENFKITIFHAVFFTALPTFEQNIKNEKINSIISNAFIHLSWRL